MVPLSLFNQSQIQDSSRSFFTFMGNVLSVIIGPKDNTYATESVVYEGKILLPVSEFKIGPGPQIQSRFLGK